MLTEKTFNTGEMIINYAESEKNGPPLLFLHGITMKWQRMRDVFSAFTEGWHVYICDFRGHGKSGRASSYKVADYINDTKTFLTQQINEPVILIGYSLGGLVSMGLGSLVPDHVRGIVLIDPPLISRNAGFEAMSYSFVHPWILRTHRVNTQNLPIEDVAAILKEANPGAEDSALLDTAKMLRSVDAGVTAAIINDHLTADFSMSSALEAITRPVLLLHGEESAGSMVRDSDIDFFKAHVPHGKLEVIRGFGHEIVFQPAADICFGHIKEFLETLV